MTAPKHATLWEALLGFQAEAVSLPKDKTNPAFKSKYTSLDVIVETVGPLLTKHGLVWSALPNRDEQGNPTLRYQLTHASGETLTGEMPLLLTKQDAQGLGSALTYSRRYAITTVLNLVADEDDDGNGARRQQGPRFGPAYDKELGQRLGAACTGLTGTADGGKRLFATLREQLGGYLPQAAALALIEADKASMSIPEVEAPEVS